MAPAPNTHIHVRTKHDAAYRRAGLTHNRAGATHARADLSDEQLAVLKADPHLVVTEVDASVSEAAAKQAEVVASMREGAEMHARDKSSLSYEDWDALLAADREMQIQAVLDDAGRQIAGAKAAGATKTEKPSAAATKRVSKTAAAK